MKRQHYIFIPIVIILLIQYIDGFNGQYHTLQIILLVITIVFGLVILRKKKN